MFALLKSLGLKRLQLWKSKRYIVWRLHTVYGVPYESGFFTAIRLVIQKIGMRQFLKDTYHLNQWLKEIQKEVHFKN